MRRILVVSVVLLVGVAVFLSLSSGPTVAEEGDSSCVSCHEKLNPGVVQQWKDSKHAKEDVGCERCHGTDHQGNDDAAKAKTPTPKTCKKCHFKQVRQFLKGKHVHADASAKAIPMMHDQPENLQALACMGCHSIGKKWEDGSVGKCDSCHTRHLFSAAEAKKPEACETCHMGEDHSQYEMWRSSKHGVIHHMMPEMGRAPVCQTCHMQDGDHAVLTGWGFLGLRLPLPDKAWNDDQMTIIKAIGPWGHDEEGMKQRVGAIETLGLARLDEASFQAQRQKMIETCSKCHAEGFAKKRLEQADGFVRETTHLMAEGVRIVDGLYADGILPQTADGPKHTDLLMFYDSPTEIEQELYRMFLFHRQKAFQGAMHMNPDYLHWFGWAPMKSSFHRIENLAAQMRKEHAAK